MAALQLRLEPTEVVMATDKGAARVRVDSTDESSPQPGACTAHCWRPACLLARAPALGMGCECSKDPFGSRSTPHYYHSKRLSTTTPSGGFQISTPHRTPRPAPDLDLGI
eukprot:scaffold5353_cov134-Isochrysis_galbana.AAC.6